MSESNPAIDCSNQLRHNIRVKGAQPLLGSLSSVCLVFRLMGCGTSILTEPERKFGELWNEHFEGQCVVPSLWWYLPLSRRKIAKRNFVALQLSVPQPALLIECELHVARVTWCNTQATPCWARERLVSSPASALQNRRKLSKWHIARAAACV